MIKILAIIKIYPLRSLALLQSIIATLGSLYFSEVWLLVPCKLCWLQRIFMYPLPFILSAGILKKENKLYHYVLPLSLVGLVISIYHNYFYYYANYFLNGANETVMVACSGGVSCTNVQIEWFGIITIPLLSLIAFTVITVTMLLEKIFLKSGRGGEN